MHLLFISILRMQVYEAKHLIAKAYINLEELQHWMDLGCGSGTFTSALAQLLPPHSWITAVVLEKQSLPAVAGENVRIDFKQGNLQDLKMKEIVHGTLMANSLHYIRNQVFFLEQLRQMSEHLNYGRIRYRRGKSVGSISNFTGKVTNNNPQWIASEGNW